MGIPGSTFLIMIFLIRKIWCTVLLIEERNPHHTILLLEGEALRNTKASLETA